MIIKHVPIRSSEKSSFAQLAKYISNDQNSMERLGAITVSNCLSDTLSASISEIVATQMTNTRAKGDKTYHLIVSFRPNENPSEDVLAAIEKKICEDIGFADHQRVSAVHYDTDNVHMHLAINKIHLVKKTLHEPFLAYKKFGAIAEEIEISFGLEPDNHFRKKVVSQNKVADMEAHTSTQSFASWVREHCFDDLSSAKNWAEFTSVLQEHGIELRQRGNGFVFSADEQMYVKASTVDRSLSKQKLEAKFGSLDKRETASEKLPKKKYKQKPYQFRIDTSALYQEYQNEKKQLLEQRNTLLSSLAILQKADIQNMKHANVLKRKGIKLFGHSRTNKRILHALVQAQTKRDLKKIRLEYQQRRRELYQSKKQMAWADWLKYQALNGRVDALQALRSREQRAKFKGNTVQASKISQGVFNLDTPAHITKKGTGYYRSSDNHLIRDNGDQLQISMNVSNQGVLELLQIAQLKFGSQLNLTGTPEFKARAVFVAAQHQLSISFTDVALEQRKQKLIEDTKNGQQRDREERSRVNRRGSSTLGQRDTKPRPKAENSESQSSESAGNSTGTRNVYPGLLEFINRALQQPNTEQTRREPPPFAKNNLRNLSELDVVRFSGRGEVLLQDDVSRQLEHQRAKSNSKLRWSSSNIENKDINHLKAVEKYIKERLEKRQRGIDIPKHIQYSGEIGQFIFAGVRNIDGFEMALLKKEENIVVKPVSTRQAQQLKRSKVGSKVQIDDQGKLMKKGRSRS